MIKLSNRLYAISEYIDSKDIVIDVGCDHALLDIYLSEKYNKVYYASDIRESALLKARENIEKYNIKNVILRCFDGLEGINEDDKIDTVVISGMGYHTILKILKNKEKLYNINKIIIESNSNPEIVRKYLIKNGFYIESENIIKDKNIFYIVSCYKRGSKKYSRIQKEVGVFKMNDISSQYINNEIKKNNVLLSIIPRSDIIRIIKLKIKIKLLKKKIL